MALKPETKFRAWLRPRLEVIPLSFWESIQQKAIQGTPDIFGCINRFFIALELKAEEGQPSKLQELKLDRINRAGGYGRIVHPGNALQILGELNGYVNLGKN